MFLSVNEQNFAQEVLKAPTPVLVHFWAPWCGICKRIVPQLVEFQAEWDGQLKLLGVNADQSLKLASTYRLKAIPTIILFDRGQVRHRVDFFLGREDLRRTLYAFMASYENCREVQLLHS